MNSELFLKCSQQFSAQIFFKTVVPDGSKESNSNSVATDGAESRLLIYSSLAEGQNFGLGLVILRENVATREIPTKTITKA